MAWVDYYDGKIPDGYKPPEYPIVLVENMKEEEVCAYIYQELYKIYNSKENEIFKGMRKQNLYEVVALRGYRLSFMFD